MAMYARGSGAIATPIGRVTVEAGGDHLVAVRIGAAPSDAERSSSPLIDEALAQLSAYFGGRLDRFDLPLAPATTPRGAALRAAIVSMGLGETASYGELARRYASAPRAIGQACARNPFPLVVPCHRVLAAGGRLGFYSAGNGPTTKQWLLDAERRIRETRG